MDLAALGLSCACRIIPVTWDLSLWHTDSLGVACRLQSEWASVVVEHGLSCSTMCGILVPQPGIKPSSSALEGGFLTTGEW